MAIVSRNVFDSFLLRKGTNLGSLFCLEFCVKGFPFGSFIILSFNRKMLSHIHSRSRETGVDCVGLYKIEPYRCCFK